jgi:adhesin transport system outer membrane protein
VRALLVLALVCAGTAAAAAAGAPAAAQPLDKELLTLLSAHPQIRSRQSSLEAARKETDRAFSRYLPSVDVNANTGPVSSQTDTRRRLGVPTFNETQRVAGISVSQNVFDGFRTPSQVRIAQLNADTARLTLEGTRQAVLFEGVNAYLDVLRNRRLVELARLTEDSIKLQASLEDERVERGAGITVDVLQAKARLQIAKERRVAFEGAFQNALSRYLQVFDRPPAPDGMSDPVPPEGLLPRTVEQAVDIALNENPALTGSLATVDAASERRRLAKSEYYPTVSVVGSASYEENFDLNPGKRNDYSVLLQANWNLFNGFATDAAVGRAAHEYRASRDTHEDMARSVAENTRIAWQQLQTARERVSLLANAVVIASEAFDARRVLREAGKDTVINVLLAEDEVSGARISLTSARYDSILAVYQLLQTIGRLDAKHLGLAGG